MPDYETMFQILFKNVNSAIEEFEKSRVIYYNDSKERSHALTRDAYELVNRLKQAQCEVAELNASSSGAEDKTDKKD